MIIVGAGGHGLESKEALIRSGIDLSELCFYDGDDSKSVPGVRIIYGLDELKAYFQVDTRFVLGVGNPFYRKRLFDTMVSCGGKITYLTDPSASLPAAFNPSCDLMPFSYVGPDVELGTGVLVNVRAHVHHNCRVGDFSEIGPGAMLLGGSSIGSMCRIGAGAVILPGVSLGDGAVVGAGAVVTRDFGDGVLLKGIPAKTGRTADNIQKNKGNIG